MPHKGLCLPLDHVKELRLLVLSTVRCTWAFYWSNFSRFLAVSWYHICD
jgi:hypothetical protein